MYLDSLSSSVPPNSSEDSLVQFYHPDVTQKIGTVTGGIVGMIYQQPLVQAAISAAVGATVAFIVTTLLRFVWDKLKKKYGIGL